jgi:protein-S-isoprenylcysteine O-methyltransferase Ste14
MQGLRAVIAMLASLVFANGMLLRILNENLVAGLYRTDADSIGIPLMEAVSTSVLIIISIGVSVALPKRSRLWRVIRAVPALFAFLLSLALSASWCTENHYSIAAAFLAVAVACAWSWWQDRYVPAVKSVMCSSQEGIARE